MDKQNLIRAIPYVILLISIGFVVYGSFALQSVENECNTHLKEQYERFYDNACTICTGEQNEYAMANISIDNLFG